MLVMGVFAAAAVQAADVPVVDREVKIETGSGRPAELDAIKRAIVEGGRLRAWDIAPAADGKTIRATIAWNNKHSMTLSIEPSATQFWVRYADSINLRYRTKDGQTTIHPMYNRKLDELVQSIQAELRKL